MNFFDNLEKYSNNIAIIKESSEYVTYSKLLREADTIGQHVKERNLVLLVCRNNFESLAGYIGFMRTGAVTVLVNDTLDYFFKNHTILQLTNLRKDIFPRLRYNYEHFWRNFREYVTADFHTKIRSMSWD